MTSQKPPHLVTKALLFLPLCDNDPIAATLLDWCCERHVCKQEELRQKREQEERERQERWEAMTEEEEIADVEERYDEWLDRQQADSVGEGEWYDRFFGYTEDPLDAYSISWIAEMMTVVVSQMEGYRDTTTGSEGPFSEEDLVKALYLLQQKNYVHVLGLKDRQLDKVFRDSIAFFVHREALDVAAISVSKH